MPQVMGVALLMGGALARCMGAPLRVDKDPTTDSRDALPAASHPQYSGYHGSPGHSLEEQQHREAVNEDPEEAHHKAPTQYSFGYSVQVSAHLQV